ncbi:MAG: 2Fe-2S iron-sulfur cluster-binding protein [Hyphomicrobiaceae bacterium]
MTAPLLLAYICATILVQVAIGIGVAVWQWRRLLPQSSVTEETTNPNVPGAWQGWREFRVARREYEDGGEAQCSFYLEPLDGVPLLPFKAGQFLTFELPIFDRKVVRCYSLSDRPDPKRFRVTIKRLGPPADRPHAPPGIASSHFHDEVHEGDVLRVKAPAGAFFIDPDATVPAVFIAGGVGITPMMSMVSWALAEQPQRILHLFYGVRHGGEHAYKQVLEDLARVHPNFHLHVIYSRPSAVDLLGRDFHHAGHVDVDLLRRCLPQGRHQFYICGPAPMMAGLVPELAAWGVPPEDIRHEAFGPASLRSGVEDRQSPVIAGPIEVQFRRSGRTLSWDGRDASLLDFAERHGIAVESGCRSGSCGSCETKLMSGNVRYGSAPDLEIKPGYCLLCIGTPQSDLMLEA